MKKIFVAAATLCIFNIQLSAQEDAPSPKSTDSRNDLHAGVKIGLNSSNVYDTKGEGFEADAKAGFAGGLYLAVPINKYLGFQPEVLFSQKGYNASGPDYSYKRTTGHINVPLMLQIKPLRFMSLVAGPQYSYLVYRQETFHTNTTTTIEQEQIENTDIRRNTLGVTGGLDFYFLSKFVISARVGWDLQDNNGDGSSTSPRYRNTWMQGMIGIRF